MAYTVEVFDGDIVEVRHDGEVEAIEAEAAGGDAAALMKEKGITRFLANTQDAVMLASHLSLFELSSTHYDVLPKGAKIALLVQASEREKELSRFSETVAQNRGVKQRVFTDRAEAIGWLREK